MKTIDISKSYDTYTVDTIGSLNGIYTYTVYTFTYVGCMYKAVI